MLRLEEVTVELAGVAVLRRVSFRVPSGGRVALIGRNGAVKTTTLRTLMGLVPASEGRIGLDGRDCTRLPGHRRTALGIGYAPEDRWLFGSFSRARWPWGASDGPFGPVLRSACTDWNAEHRPAPSFICTATWLRAVPAFSCINQRPIDDLTPFQSPSHQEPARSRCSSGRASRACRLSPLPDRRGGSSRSLGGYGPC